jgi:ParB-like chromosome segregation protein Spo0J
MTNSRTIDALLTIMNDSDIRTRRRIEAAEQLLDFEAPDEAVIRAREYLVSVFENADEDLGDRMNAIKASRKVEAAKVSPKVVHLNRGTAIDRKEAWRGYERSKLRTAIINATMAIPPKGWDESFGPDYLPPEGDAWPPWWDAEGRRRR